MLDDWQQDLWVDAVAVMMRRGETGVRGWCDSALAATSFGISRMTRWKAQRERLIVWSADSPYRNGYWEKEARVGRRGLCSCVHVFGLWQRRYYYISRHTRGMQGEIPAPWVVPSHLPSPSGYHFILPFPPQPGNFPVCAAPGGNYSLYKQCFSGHDWILQVMASLTKTC